MTLVEVVLSGQNLSFRSSQSARQMDSGKGESSMSTRVELSIQVRKPKDIEHFEEGCIGVFKIVLKSQVTQYRFRFE